MIRVVVIVVVFKRLGNNVNGKFNRRYYWGLREFIRRKFFRDIKG